MNIIGPGSLHGLNVFVFPVGQGGPRLGLSVLPQVKFPENFFLLRGNHAALMQFAMAPPPPQKTSGCHRLDSSAR